jgi:hypothetical protein
VKRDLYRINVHIPDFGEIIKTGIAKKWEKTGRARRRTYKKLKKERNIMQYTGVLIEFDIKKSTLFGRI